MKPSLPVLSVLMLNRWLAISLATMTCANWPIAVNWYRKSPLTLYLRGLALLRLNRGADAAGGVPQDCRASEFYSE